ncbi:MAG: hypothetical protein WC242_03200 [Candidatus Paceibacterota bacterium]|jgi:hypothetical protein
MKKIDEAYEFSKTQTTVSVFLETYNQSIPDVFPHASIENLGEFQNFHPALFKDRNLWSIAQHRKKLIDWLFENSFV